MLKPPIPRNVASIQKVAIFDLDREKINLDPNKLLKTFIKVNVKMIIILIFLPSHLMQDAMGLDYTYHNV